MKISQMLSALTSVATTKSQKTETLQTESHATEAKNTSQVQHKIDQLLTKYSVEDQPSARENINQFMARAKGSETDKLATVEMTLSKGITPTTSNLMDVHAALNESAYTSEQIDALTVKSEGDVISKETTTEVKKVIANLKLPEALKEVLSALVDKGYTLKDALTAVVSAVGGQGGNTSQMLKSLSQNIDVVMSKLEVVVNALSQGESVKLEPLKVQLLLLLIENGQTLEDAIGTEQHEAINKADNIIGSSQVAGEGMSSSKTSNLQTADSVLGDALDLNDGSKEALRTTDKEALQVIPHSSVDEAMPSGDESLEEVTSLDDTANDQSPLSDFIEESVTAILSQLEAQMVSLSETFELKQFLVTESTEKTIEMKTNFTAFKDDVASMLASPEEKSAESLKQTVSEAIEAIDKMISKQEVTLYASMKTERDLLVLSSELREASNLLEQGKTNEAIAIVSKGYHMVKALQYDPDKQKIMLFMTQKGEEANQILTQQGTGRQQKIVDMLNSLQDQQGQHHARDVVETLRFLGHNHENEVASYIENKDKSQEQAQLQTNIKEILLKMMKDETEQRTVTSSEKSLMNLSGQQMMNDSQQNGQRRLYYFNYPIVDAEELNEMKIYVSGNQHKSQMDWQNTELYFGMSLKKQGDTGIKVKVTGGQMTIKILNDTPESLKTLFESYATQLEAIGFKDVRIESEQYQKTPPVGVVNEDVKGQAVTDKTTNEGSLDYKV